MVLPLDFQAFDIGTWWFTLGFPIFSHRDLDFQPFEIMKSSKNLMFYNLSLWIWWYTIKHAAHARQILLMLPCFFCRSHTSHSRCLMVSLPMSSWCVLIISYTHRRWGGLISQIPFSSNSLCTYAGRMRGSRSSICILNICRHPWSRSYAWRWCSLMADLRFWSCQGLKISIAWCS